MISLALSLTLSAAQVNCLNMAYNYGEPYGLAQTFRAVVFIESSGCVNEVGDDGRSLGPAQIQVYTASITCNCLVTGERLTSDRSFNLELGARFLASCFSEFWPDKRRAILCYNAGIPAASKATDSEVLNSSYVRRVEQAIKALQGLPDDED